MALNACLQCLRQIRPKSIQASVRHLQNATERLYADRTYYVRTDGSDSNDGLVNNSGGAFVTIQKAWDVIKQALDLNGFNVVVQIGDGTYTAGLAVRGDVPGQNAGSAITFQGNSGMPANVLVSITGGNCFNASEGARLLIKDLEMRTTTSGACIAA